MATFAIITHTRPDLVGAKVREIYPDNYVLPPSAWFVSDNGTTIEVRDKLELTGGKLGAQAVVIKVGGWAGFGPTDIWEWFKSRQET